ncbi:carboxypeptidase M32, partial [Candidatus Acetothermia bacterium]
TGLDDGASMGIHESQSRMWENMVGRGRPVWGCFAPLAGEVFPAFAKVPPEEIYRAVNVVEPSLIRVEADEVTYNLHIMLRFELEEGLINGRIAVSDLPELWNEAMDRYLGVVPEDDAHGVLQDVHWSGGMFGYFPSYMLGNLYAAQLYAKAQEEIPDLEGKFAAGDFSPLLSWLREKIHRFGKIYDPVDLLERATGEKPDPNYFVDYVIRKYSAVYGL